VPPTTTTPHVSQPVDLTAALDTLLHLVFAMWPVLVLVVAAFVVKKGLEIRETRRLARSGIEQIDTMDGRTFEVYLSGSFGGSGTRSSSLGSAGTMEPT
jgi:hypothetical protein